MQHPRFLSAIDALGGGARQRIDEAAPMFAF
jgi:hypothetical protein